MFRREEVLDFIIESHSDGESNVIGLHYYESDDSNHEEEDNDVSEAATLAARSRHVDVCSGHEGSNSEDEHVVADDSASSQDGMSTASTVLADQSVLDVDLDLDNEDISEYMLEWTRNQDNFPLVPSFNGTSGFSFPTQEDGDSTTPFSLYPVCWSQHGLPF